MKKIYKKPTVYIEQYSLSAHIAGDCGAGANSGGMLGTPAFNTPYDCAWKYEDTILAYCSPDACKENACKNPEDFNGYCYNSGADDIRVFSS